jgi:two-component system KDP operon response regulator KdpE
MTTFKQRCVLVVDDEPKVLRFLEIGLKLRGFYVLTTTSGKEALELVSSEKPDVMLLDIVMPDLNGYEVLRQLRMFSDIPVIAISASPTTYSDIIRQGADFFIMKPLDPNNIATMIDGLLDR